MAKLRAPDSFASFSFGGGSFSANADGSIDIPDVYAALAIAHGCRDNWSAADESDDGASASESDEFDRMDRNALFAWLRERKIRVGTPINYEGLRKACREAKAQIEFLALGREALSTPVSAESSPTRGGLGTGQGRPVSEASQEPQGRARAPEAMSVPATSSLPASGGAARPGAAIQPETIESVSVHPAVADNPQPVPAP